MKYLVIAGATALAMMFTACNNNAANQGGEGQVASAGAQSAVAPTLYHSVPRETYGQCDAITQRLIDLVDGAANALLAIEQNNEINDYIAVLAFSTQDVIFPENTLAIGRNNPNDKIEGNLTSYKLKGISGDNLELFTKIVARAKAQESASLQITLQLDGEGCVDLTY